MNKVILIGNLTKDPELRTTAQGKTVCSFFLAVNRNYSDRDGNKITDYHNIVVFGTKGESCGKYLAKGKKACVFGELQYSKYEKNGETKYSTAIVASEVEFLTPKTQEKEVDAPYLEGFMDLPTEDLPF